MVFSFKLQRLCSTKSVLPKVACRNLFSLMEKGETPYIVSKRRNVETARLSKHAKLSKFAKLSKLANLRNNQNLRNCRNLRTCETIETYETVKTC